MTWLARLETGGCGGIGGAVSGGGRSLTIGDRGDGIDTVLALTPRIPMRRSSTVCPAGKLKSCRGSERGVCGEGKEAIGVIGRFAVWELEETWRSRKLVEVDGPATGPVSVSKPIVQVSEAILARISSLLALLTLTNPANRRESPSSVVVAIG